MDRFSRWLRAICTILLSRNTAADRLKSLGYVEQAYVVMDSSGNDPGETEAVCLPLDDSSVFTIRASFIPWTNGNGCSAQRITRVLNVCSESHTLSSAKSFQTQYQQRLATGRSKAMVRIVNCYM